MLPAVWSACMFADLTARMFAVHTQFVGHDVMSVGTVARILVSRAAYLMLVSTGQLTVCFASRWSSGIPVAGIPCEQQQFYGGVGAYCSAD